jgi:hypothetical protein
MTGRIYNLVICDFCAEVLDASEYGMHLRLHHQKDTRIEFDLREKIEHDKMFFMQFQGLSASAIKSEILEIRGSQGQDRIHHLNRYYIDKNVDYKDDKIVSLSVIWDDIIFDKNELRLKPDSIRVNSVLKPIPFKGSIPELNNIKQEYFERKFHRLIKLKYRNGNFLTNDNPIWKELSKLIEEGKTYYETSLVTKRSPKKRFQVKTYDSFDQFISDFEKEPKINYYKFLAVKQSMNEVNIITIKEFIGGNVETSILFQLHTKKDKILLIWENVNESRASILFTFEKEKAQEYLKKIKLFICNPNLLHKRYRFLKNSKEIKRMRIEMGFYKRVMHSDLDKFKSEINSILYYN